MEFTKETKERFVELFKKHEIVIVSREYGRCFSFEHKFIGVHNGMKWDFTPLIIELSGCRANRYKSAARGHHQEILGLTLCQLSKENYDVPAGCIAHLPDYCQVFYF